MNILFVSKHLQYNVATPESEPLGGSESCLSYLARALAARGHNVTVMLNLPPGTPDTLMGVRHVSHARADKAFFDAGGFDAIITSNAPAEASQFRTVSPSSLHIAWVHMLPGDFATDSPRLDADLVVYVSQTQRAAYPQKPPAHVIGNGVAPAFESMFGSADELLSAKENRAAYTSVPYRGLGMLIAVMDRSNIDTAVDIYASMRLYQQSDAQYAAMFDRARKDARMAYHGALPQAQLAARLRSTAFLFYTLGVPETFCLSAIEAMAAGMDVISADIGALKETTMGYAALIPCPPGMQAMEYMASYKDLMEKRVAAFKADPRRWAEERFEQVKAVNGGHTWNARASEWENMLAEAIEARKQRAPA